MLKRFRHFFCRNYLIRVDDVEKSLWIGTCSQCGYQITLF
jgi:hypothetical protein